MYLKNRSAKISVRDVTLRRKLRITLAITPSHGIQTPGQPFPTPCVWQGSNWSTISSVSSMTRPRQIPTLKAGIETRYAALEGEGGSLPLSYRGSRANRKKSAHLTAHAMMPMMPPQTSTNPTKTTAKFVS